MTSDLSLNDLKLKALNLPTNGNERLKKFRLIEHLMHYSMSDLRKAFPVTCEHRCSIEDMVSALVNDGKNENDILEILQPRKVSEIPPEIAAKHKEADERRAKQEAEANERFPNAQKPPRMPVPAIPERVQPTPPVAETSCYCTLCKSGTHFDNITKGLKFDDDYHYEGLETCLYCGQLFAGIARLCSHIKICKCRNTDLIVYNASQPGDATNPPGMQIKCGYSVAIQHELTSRSRTFWKIIAMAEFAIKNIKAGVMSVTDALEHIIELEKVYPVSEMNMREIVNHIKGDVHSDGSIDPRQVLCDVIIASAVALKRLSASYASGSDGWIDDVIGASSLFPHKIEIPVKKSTGSINVVDIPKEEFVPSGINYNDEEVIAEIKKRLFGNKEKPTHIVVPNIPRFTQLVTNTQTEAVREHRVNTMPVGLLPNTQSMPKPQLGRMIVRPR